MEKIVSTRDGNIVPVGIDGYLSYDVGEALTLHNPSLGEPSVLLDHVYSVCSISRSEAIILAGAKAYIYDAVAGGLALLESSDPLLARLPTVPGKCATRTVRIVDNGLVASIGRESIEATDLTSGWEGMARGPNGDLIADATGDSAVMVLGNDYGDYDGPPGASGTALTECSLVLSYRSDRREISLGVRTDISAATLSPDGNRVAVVNDRNVEVYDVVTGALMYAMPSSHSHAVFWWGNNHLVYVGESSEVGAGFSKLYMADIEKAESYGLTDDAEVTVSILSGVVDGYLYFSGVTYSGETSERSAYRISLEGL